LHRPQADYLVFLLFNVLKTYTLNLKRPALFFKSDIHAVNFLKCVSYSEQDWHSENEEFKGSWKQKH